jgi:hypothetical protein
VRGRGGKGRKEKGTNRERTVIGLGVFLPGESRGRNRDEERREGSESWSLEGAV